MGVIYIINIQTIAILFVLYFLLCFIGKVTKGQLSKTLSLLGLTLKIAALAIVLGAILISEVNNVTEIIKNNSLKNLDVSDAIVIITIILASVDILDTCLEWADKAIEKIN